jgi:hypothetical protein
MTTAEVSADGDNIGLISTNKGELRINDNSLNTVVGTTADAASQSGASTLMAYTRSIRDDIRSLATDTNPLTVKTDQTTHGTTDLVAADITKIAGTTVATGNGVTGTGSIRVTVASDNSAIPGNVSQIGGNSVLTGNGTTGTGSQRVTIASDNTPIQTRNAGTATPSRIASAAATDNKTEIAASGGCRIISVAGAVARSSPVYLKFYNASGASTTVGTTTPYITLPLPAGGANPTSFQFDVNQVFASGACTYAMTTAVADNSTAALTAADVVGLTVIWSTN